jgi:hypothetical protein
MTGSELDEVTALVGRILPDPNGFVQRLLDQAVTRWGGAVEPGAPGEEPIEVSARPQPPGGGDEPDGQWAQLVEMSNLLAAALGACDCWGLEPRCPVCEGAGSSGWIDPDLELFQEFVGPAAARLTARGFDDDPTADGPTIDGDRHPDPSTGPPDADTDEPAPDNPTRHNPTQQNPTRQNPTYRTRQGVPV